MQRKTSGFTSVVLMLALLGGFGFLLWRNAAPPAPISPALPVQATPTAITNEWAALLSAGFGDNSTPLPTVAIPTQARALPTAAINFAAGQVVSAANVGEGPVAAIARGTTPTPPPATIPSNAANNAPQATARSITREPSDWRPPPLEPPISRDPLGRDHYILRRPVEANANNAVLRYYPYGADGSSANAPSRVHHGIDMPNDVGSQVRAAGSGWVRYAADDRAGGNAPIFQNSPSYGNVVLIEHDFGYNNQPIYTLYAHLAAVLVTPGQYVQAGDPIGLSGNTGNVTGPHVHFEVRVGGDRYADTYNPVLWMVPYVNHGVIAGRVVDAQGEWVQDAEITVRNWATGLIFASTTSYIFGGTSFDVNSDPAYQENFVIPDVPVGRYDLITTINGERVVGQVQVFEGMTAFVELKPPTRQASSND